MKIRACLITLFIAGVAAFECDCERRGEIPLMFEEHESKFCQMKSFSQKFTEALKKASCENPRDTVVHLDSGDPSVEYVPRAVTVKRCAGFCSLYLTCAPKEKVLVEFGVYQKRVGDSTHTCGTIHVEEHVRCRCQCKVQESHCNEFQSYHSQDCACRCLNEHEKEDCERSNKVWDKDSCQCKCREIESCISGFIFVPSLCRCAKIPDS